MNPFDYLPLAIGLVTLVALAATYRLWIRLFGIVLVPDHAVGVVYKKFVLLGANRALPDGAIVALKGEAGLQADTLSPGVHYGYWPWQYDVKVQDFITIPSGKIGLVASRDGQSLREGRVLAKRVECDSFQNARKFLESGGQRGPQIAIIPPGTYRINTGLFDVTQAPVTDVPENKIGIVTTTDGAPLPTGDIAGAEVAAHNSFQDPELFIANGGHKGLQEQVLRAGRYFINPLFAKVELADLQTVPIAHVGVVIAYVGKEGKDVTGESFKHGNLVSRSERGVWVSPLEPGRYPINPYTHKVENVPTANVVLNWADAKTESHQLDKNLSTITVRSSDGFKFNLDVSQIIHIPHNEAPKVIARFGSMANLVTQVLEPTIGNYFRNAAQSSDVISFLKNRQERQAEARAAIASALDEYNVGAVDTLIGDIVPPDSLMMTLTDRKLAEQQNITFQTQKLAEDTRKDLEQARATADTQAGVVNAQRDVEIKEFQAQASVRKARGDAESKTLNASADAQVTELNGAAEAGKVRAIGEAEAEVIKKKTDALGTGYSLIEIARALSGSGKQLVPQIVVGGGAQGAGGSVIDLLLLEQLREQLNKIGPTEKTL
jgi:uncharacterized membrane protein YqiK